MPNLTCQAIRQSFMKLLNERPLNQITVKDVVEDCGINRNSFYYHYQDLPSLIEEIITGEAERIISTHTGVDSIEDCLDVAIGFALENKKAVLHLCDSTNRELYEQYLWRVCEHVISEYIDTLIGGQAVAPEDRQIIIRFYKCTCFGLIVEWQNQGMKEDLRASFHRLCELRRGMAEDLIRQSLRPASSR